MKIERVHFPAVHMAFTTYCGPVDGIVGAVPALLAAVRAAGLQPLGPPVILYPCGEQDPAAVVARLCVRVPLEFRGHAGLRTLTLGPVDVAVAHHTGPHHDLGLAYDALSNWVDENGFSVAEGISETLVAGPHDGLAPEAWRTDVAVRIRDDGLGAPPVRSGADGPPG